ncbi:hypothetical protein [uncultured Cohaesibacter sp.]|uniref:hypothetical protein n=1 Tax=uncultured Cohaesibacter sp. TaxID=1002546 RepID=UPI002A0A8248|nr:hypothetical protein [uncultured Cohaesibacter sp.]
MSGLKLVPEHHSPAGNSTHFQLLLTDGRQQPQKTVAPVEVKNAIVPAPTPLQYASNQQAYIQAQLLNNEPNRNPRRHSATRSPREVVRAYGQARRRPQAIADMPIHRKVV